MSKQTRSPHPKVAVIATVLNEHTSIAALLTGLSQQTLQPDEVVIVDAGSSDGTFEWLQTAKQQFPKLVLKVVQQSGNRSQGRNLAIQNTAAEWLAITDAGCVPVKEWLAELVQTAQDIAAASHWPVVAGYYQGQAKTAFEAAELPFALVMPSRVNPQHFLPASRSMLIDRRAWQLVGGFPEHLLVSEDYWLARTLWQLSKTTHPQLQFSFNQKAIVKWRPRRNLAEFLQMIAAFATGDVRAGLWRPKVAAIFGRYVIAMVWLITYVVTGNTWLGVGFMFASAGYIVWSWWKHAADVAAGQYWLPILQLTSDVAVMWGTIRGGWQVLRR